MNAAKVIGGKFKMTQDHDEYAKAMGSFGLRRGEKSSELGLSVKEKYVHKKEEEEHRERTLLYAKLENLSRIVERYRSGDVVQGLKKTIAKQERLLLKHGITLKDKH